MDSYGLDKASREVQCGAPSRMTLRQRMIERQKQAEEHLADVNQALKFLDENPNFEQFHNLIGKAGF